jgi:hypothetical protein
MWARNKIGGRYFKSGIYTFILNKVVSSAYELQIWIHHKPMEIKTFRTYHKANEHILHNYMECNVPSHTTKQ